MITWLKLDVNILDDAKIKIIRAHPDGDKVFVLWVGLLCLAMKSDRPGIIEISDGLPYTVDDLANMFSIEKRTVEMGLALFKKYRMIDLLNGDTIEVINFSKHQKLDEIEHKRGLTRARVQRYRDKQRNGNALLTLGSVTVTPTDIDIDKDIDKEKEKRGAFAPPSIDEIKNYCQETNRTIDPQMFSDFYTAKNWMIGKNKMKDWKAAVRTWAARNADKPVGPPRASPPSSVISCPACGDRILKADLIEDGCVNCRYEKQISRA